MIAATTNWQNAASLYQRGGGGKPILLLTIGKASLTDPGGYPRILTNAHMSSPPYYPWLNLDGAELSQSVNDLEGSSNLSNVSISCLDGDLQNPHAISNDIAAGASFPGQTAILWYGFEGLGLADYLQMATMIVDHTNYEEDGNVLAFVLRDNSLYTNGFCFIYAQNGLLTADQNPCTIMGNPFDPSDGLVLTALLDSGLPMGLINTASLAALEQNIYFSTNMMFQVTYPPIVKDWIENEILKPLGCYWYWNNLGQFTVQSLLPAAPPAVAMALAQFDIAESTFPTPVESDSYTSALSYRFDMDSNGQNSQSNFLDYYAPADNLYGGVSQVRTYVSRGVRSSLGGYRLAHLMAQMIFSRYGLKPLTLKITGFAPSMALEMGDKITISHPLVPNGKFPPSLRTPGSSVGIQGTLWEVLNANKNLEDATVDLDLLHVSWQLPAYAWLIAPDGTPAYASASAAQKAANMFVCNASNLYSNGDAAHTLW
jgi:hypothetical protein